MAEMNSNNIQSQIYMEKLLESHRQNEALRTQNETLNTQNSDLTQQNKNLGGQNKEMEDQINSLKTDNKQLRDKLTAADCWARSKAQQARTRMKALIAVLLLIVTLLIGVTVYGRCQINFYKDEYANERRQRIKTESDLEKTQEALSEAEGELDKFHNGFAEMSQTLFGSSSEDFYAEECFIVLHAGETKNVKIHKEDFRMRIAESDEEAITAEEIESGSDISEVEITAHSPGYYTVEFAEITYTLVHTGGSWDLAPKTVEAFDLLVIVLEE